MSTTDLPEPPPAPRGRERRQRVQAAETGLAVLKGLGRLGGRASLSVLAAHVGESPAKVHRYLASLVEEGFVTQAAGSQQYLLGAESIALGLAAMRQAEPIRAAEASLGRLREALSLTCFVAVMGNKGATIVRFEEPWLPISVNARVGSVLPLLWSATGRVLLAWQHDDARLRAMAEQELAEAPTELRAQLDAADPIGRLAESVLAAGCAVVKDTNLRGISAVSAPVFDHAGRVCAALTVLGPTGGFDASVRGTAAKALREEARAVSAAMGFASTGLNRAGGMPTTPTP